ncbi:MAG: cation transporter [Alphaproteobacteria bacterium]|nr:cation transporter [Alphaproteobacteria bacterium]MDE2498757.1 cation transporter [Alphaproteobacteria bacterium]
MTGCGCGEVEARQAGQRRTLRIALALNVTMFAVGIVAGIVAQSSGLIADALDMLADASAYAIALMAIKRSGLFKARAATWSGTVLLILGAGVLLDAGRRGLFGSSPQSIVMIAVATMSLLVNATVLYLLSKQQEKKEVHLRATYIFTRADVVANLAVILSGAILLATGYRYVDLAIGAAIGIYVIREALEILGEGREAARRAK